MLMRTDPFRAFDQLTRQVFGSAASPAFMPMDAWRDNTQFVVQFDLPGVDPGSIDLNIERNALTVRAERKSPVGEDKELLAAERPQGVFSRQVILSDALNSDDVSASYDDGVLTVRIPVAEQAKPRKIEVTAGTGKAKEINA